MKNLKNDNVVSANAKNLGDLDIKPTAMETVLPEYLWRYRVSGQYVNKKFSKRAEKVKFEYLFYLKEVSYGLQNCCGWCHW